MAESAESPDTQSTVVKGASPMVGVVVLGLFASVWLGMTALVTTLAWDQIRGETGLMVFLAIFWTAGVFLAGMAVKAVLHAGRFGRSTLALDAVPARLGGWLSGVIRAPHAVQGADVQVSLECVRTIRSRSSGDSSTSTSVVWRQTRLLDGTRCLRSASAIEIPFAFRLPTSEEAAREANQNVISEIFAVREIDLVGEDIGWHVAVGARLPGVDYGDRFKVPVAAPGPGAAVPAFPPREMPELAGERLAQHMPARLDYRLDADVFVFPMKPSWVFWPLAFMAVAAAGALAPHIPALSALPERPVFWTALVSGILGVLSVVGLLLDTRRIEIRPQDVRIRRGAFGVGIHRTIPRTEIAEVEEETSKSDPPSYLVNIRLRNGKRYWAMPPSSEPDRAAALAARLRQILQLPERAAPPAAARY